MAGEQAGGSVVAAREGITALLDALGRRGL